ncbi:MAG TPA: hypothetical protein VNR37_04840 [Microbacteriaceae bacterium]|nr:hypothetical protein [Microbacteriaceae bacterium]
MHDIPTTRSRPWRTTRLLALIAFSIAALALPLASPPAASASTHGAGEYDAGHWHGSYMEDGAYAYCLDYHLDWDGGLAPTWAGTVTSYGGLAPQQLAAIGAAVAALGQTGDPAEARAVADAIWYVTDGVVPWGPTAPRAQQIIDWMAAWVAAPDAGTVTMTIARDGTGPRDAVLTIDALSAGTAVTGMIRLSDGVFADTGGDTLVGEFAAGQRHAVTGLPATPADYRIGAQLTGTATLSTFAAAAPVYEYGPGYQSMIGPAATAIIPMTGAALTADAIPAVAMTTSTTASVPAGTGVRDTALLDDHGAGIDLSGWSLGFDLYEFPAGAEEIAEPVCTPATRVHSSARIPLSAAGEVTSDAYLAERPGTYGWIATLYDPDGAPHLVGTCGEPDETLRVEAVLALTGDDSGRIGVALAGGLALGGAGFAAAAANERRRRR